MLMNILYFILILLSPYFPVDDMLNEKLESKIISPITTAIVERDADTLEAMSSQHLKDNYPQLKDDIDSLLNTMEGDIVSVEPKPDGLASGVIGTQLWFRMTYTVNTSSQTYWIYISYCSFSLFNSKEPGISRMMLQRLTDVNNSCVIDPDHYISSDDDTQFTDTRYLREAKGTMADEQIFLVCNDMTLAGSYNVECSIYGPGHYVLKPGEWVKVYLVREGNEPPTGILKKADFTCDSEDGDYNKKNVRGGRYYLYIETSDPELQYSVLISTYL